VKILIWCCVSGGIAYWWEATHPMPSVNRLIVAIPLAMQSVVCAYALVSLPEYLRLVFGKERGL